MPSSSIFLTIEDFGVARRRLREMLIGVDLDGLHGVALRQGGQPAAVVVALTIFCFFVLAFFIQLQEAVEDDDRACRPQRIRFAVVALGFDVGTGLFHLGR